jgi:hypothetical protein
MKVRSLFALAIAALVAPVAASAAPQSASRTAPVAMTSSALEIGGFVGYETDDLSGITLRVDGELPFQALSPQIKLSWVGSIGFSHLTEDGFGGEVTANILKLVPAARFSLPVNPQFTLFADAGLGLYYSAWEIKQDAIFVPGFGAIGGGKIDDSEVGLMMRIGAGAWFQVNPATRIGASIEFNPYFGDVIATADQTTFILQAGAMFRM